MEGQNTHCTKDWRHVRSFATLHSPISPSSLPRAHSETIRQWMSFLILSRLETGRCINSIGTRVCSTCLSTREVTDRLIHLVRTARVFVSWASVLGTFGPLRTMTLEQRVPIFSVSNSSPLLVASLCLTDLRADKLYSSSQRIKHGGHRDESTHSEFYAPRSPGTDGQGSYFGDTLRAIVNDRFRTMTLSRNPELWQSLPAEKQNELENSPEFSAIEEELERLSTSKDDSTIRDRRKELQTQRRKLISEALRRFQKHQPRNLSKANKIDEIGHHRTRFSRFCCLMPLRRYLADGLFTTTSLRSEGGWAALRAMIDLDQQESEVTFRPGLEPGKYCCPVRRTQDRFVPPRNLPS